MPVAPERSAEVVVVGSGPAGWAVADQCTRHGLHTLLLAPQPDARWPATYGLWADQCNALPSGAGFVSSAPVLAAEHVLARGYRVLDNEAVLGAYTGGAVEAVADSVSEVEPGPGGVRVRLASGGHLRCGFVIDASGQQRVLSGGPPRGPRVEQTAYGVVVPAQAAAPLAEPGSAIIMRWADAAYPPATFLYAVPLPGERMLLEETSLARRPGLAVEELRARLLRRLTAAGIDQQAVRATEHVRFAMDLPRPEPREGTVAFGVAAGMMHPATGYSVGDALSTAPGVAAALAEALPQGTRAATRAARAAVWPPSALAVHRLRRWGLRTLLALPAARVPEFFDRFFSIPEELQRAYLSGRDELRGTTAAMNAVFAAAPGRLRASMLAGALRGEPSG